MFTTSALPTNHLPTYEARRRRRALVPAILPAVHGLHAQKRPEALEVGHAEKPKDLQYKWFRKINAWFFVGFGYLPT